MSRKKTESERFAEQLITARRYSEIEAYYAEQLQRALDGGLTKKAARGKARELTAEKCGLTPDRVGQILGGPRRDGEWSALQHELQKRLPAQEDLAAFDRRAGVLQWLTPEEMSGAGSLPLEEIRQNGFSAAVRAAKAKMRPLPELALLAIPRANAEVRRLEIALRNAEAREKQVVGQLLARTRELEGKLRAAEKKIKQLAEQCRDEDIARAARNMGTRRR